MRILFVGNIQGTSTSVYYYTSLMQLGISVVPFEVDYLHAPNFGQKVWVKLTHEPWPPRAEALSLRLVDICKRNPFDAVLVFAENFIGRTVLEEIRAVCAHPPLFLYHSHDNNFSDGVLKPSTFTENLCAYDIVFTTKSQNVARYQKLGQGNVHYLPSAFEPLVHRPVAAHESRYASAGLQVTFIGTYDHSRDRYVEAAPWDRLRVWGGRWNRYPEFEAWRDRIDPRAIYYFEFADVIHHSQISLGLLREEAEDRHTERTFEIPACGGFQLAPRNPEIQAFFREDQEIVLFDSPEELKDKIDFYLGHETERKRIARRGHERCLSSGHRYLDRAQEIVKLLGARLPKAEVSHQEQRSTA